MSRYIDVDLLMQKWLFRGKSQAMYRDEIRSIPTADVVPVVHGEWKDGICTNCKCGLRETWFDEPISYASIKYCPYCGAKMDGEV